MADFLDAEPSLMHRDDTGRTTADSPFNSGLATPADDDDLINLHPSDSALRLAASRTPKASSVDKDSHQLQLLDERNIKHVIEKISTSNLRHSDDGEKTVDLKEGEAGHTRSLSKAVMKAKSFAKKLRSGAESDSGAISDDANVQVEHSSPPENASAHRVDDELALPASPTLVPQVDFEPENTTFESLLEYMGGSPSASRTGDDDEISTLDISGDQLKVEHSMDSQSTNPVENISAVADSFAEINDILRPGDSPMKTDDTTLDLGSSCATTSHDDLSSDDIFSSSMDLRSWSNSAIYAHEDRSGRIQTPGVSPAPQARSSHDAQATPSSDPPAGNHSTGTVIPDQLMPADCPATPSLGELGNAGFSNDMVLDTSLESFASFASAESNSQLVVENPTPKSLNSFADLSAHPMEPHLRNCLFINDPTPEPTDTDLEISTFSPFLDDDDDLISLNISSISASALFRLPLTLFSLVYFIPYTYLVGFFILFFPDSLSSIPPPFHLPGKNEPIERFKHWQFCAFNHVVVFLSIIPISIVAFPQSEVIPAVLVCVIIGGTLAAWGDFVVYGELEDGLPAGDPKINGACGAGRGRRRRETTELGKSDRVSVWCGVMGMGKIGVRSGERGRGLVLVREKWDDEERRDMGGEDEIVDVSDEDAQVMDVEEEGRGVDVYEVGEGEVVGR